jgi:glycosyltransferase involved in cell wall biosynthesis
LKKNQGGNKMGNKISVIIPVYNTEKYLSACFDSLLEQTYENFEVIAINDGSSDTSAEIVSDYARRDKRFKLVNQENKGASAARNLGLQLIAGNYVYFIDSDDYINKYTFEICMKEFEKNNVDMLIFDGKGVVETQYLEEKKEIRDYEMKMSGFYDKSEFLDPAHIMNPYEYFKSCFYNDIFRANVYFYMVKKEVIDQCKFNENITYYEDVLFLYEISQKIHRIKYISQQLYYRRLTGTSLMTVGNNAKIVEHLLICLHEIEKDSLKNKKNGNIIKMFVKFLNELVLNFWLKCEENLRSIIVLDRITKLRFDCFEKYIQLDKVNEQEYKDNIKQLKMQLRGAIV